MNFSREIPARPALLAACAVAVLAVGFFLAPAGAAWPGRNGLVVYVGLDQNPATNLPIPPYVATGLRTFDPGVAGSRTQLTTDSTDRDPQVSPDGRHVVFSRTVSTAPGRSISGVFVVGIDGNGLTQVTAGGLGEASDIQPTFYPSGKRIAFVRVGGQADPEQRGAIYSVGLDGSGLRHLISGLAEVRTPAVSPGGRQIVFECRHYLEPGVEYSWEHICSIRPNGSHRRDLTPRFKDGQPAIDPDFSPSGRTIAFEVGPGTAADVFTVRANGARLGAFTNRGPRGGRKFPRKLGYDDPAFSPSGDEILAVARSGSRPRFVRIPLDDPKHPRPLDASIVGRSPVWAPSARP
ncbi:MAG TPA: hypothetical protein VIY71_00435 [Solirubrobacterales bacterium]